MLFNSIEFFIFLPIVFVLYWLVFEKKHSWQNILILVASYIFYGWWSWKFLGLLMLCTLLDYLYGFKVASSNKRTSKVFLWLSIINNLGILAIFKYYDFFALELNQALNQFGIQSNLTLLHFTLPIGISFYTFHGMSYIFDIYNGKQKPANKFIEYAIFVSFFPLLVAGPIERASNLLPQVQNPRQFRYKQLVDGCRLILWGLFKKVVIADGLAGIVNSIFNNYQNENGVTLIIGAVAFSFQIYGDFSGYSDIAIGTAKLFGFELLSNFRFPYFSRNISEFWKRWNISLSSWLRDYIFIPLGGSKNGKVKTIRNIIIVFLLSGLWHGASWHYVVWASIHICGYLLVLLFNQQKEFKSERVLKSKIPFTIVELWQVLITFSFVTTAWIFFRANTVNEGVDYIKTIYIDISRNPSQLIHWGGHKLTFLYILTLVVFDWWFINNERELRVTKNIFIRISIYIIFAILILLNLDNAATFIYFQF